MKRLCYERYRHVQSMLYACNKNASNIGGNNCIVAMEWMNQNK
jgi:hypothetical protein